MSGRKALPDSKEQMFVTPFSEHSKFEPIEATALPASINVAIGRDLQENEYSFTGEASVIKYSENEQTYICQPSSVNFSREAQRNLLVIDVYRGRAISLAHITHSSVPRSFQPANLPFIDSYRRNGDYVFNKDLEKRILAVADSACRRWIQKPLHSELFIRGLEYDQRERQSLWDELVATGKAISIPGLIEGGKMYQYKNV